MRKSNSKLSKMLLPRHPRTNENKVHDRIDTAAFGEIRPTMYEYLSPGDSFRLDIRSYCRAATFQAPIFSEIKLKNRVFCVPERKLVPNFESFIQSSPSDGMLKPFTTILDMVVASTAAYHQNYLGRNNSHEELFGVPDLVLQYYYYLVQSGNDPGVEPTDPGFRATMEPIIVNDALDVVDKFTNKGKSPGTVVEGDPDYHPFFLQRISLVPFLAYLKVFYDWIADLRFVENLYEHWFTYYNGPGSLTYDPYFSYTSTFQYHDKSGVLHTDYNFPFFFTPKSVLYPKDYFTTASDGSQAGPILSIGVQQKLDLFYDVVQEQGKDTQAVAGSPTQGASPSVPESARQLYALGYEAGDTSHQGMSAIGNIWAKINEADLITPTKLRWQMALQRYVEGINAVGGQRYNDFVLGMYGIRVPDPFLQRSIYLGGNSIRVKTDEVIATADGSSGDTTSQLGEFAGRGEFKGSSPVIGGRVKEHCVLLCVQWIMPQTYYYQGLPSRLQKLSVLDYPLPQFAYVGEQPIRNKELFFGLYPDAIFGYTPRYMDLKIMHDEVHGDFKGELSYWHTGRLFSSTPRLGANFLAVRNSDGHNRIFAIVAENERPFRIWQRFVFYHNMPLPKGLGNGSLS